MKLSGLSLMLLGLGVTIGILRVLLFLFSWISTCVGISDKMCGVVLGLIAMLSWFWGSFFVGYIKKQNGLIWGVVHSGCMFVFILLLSIIINGAQASILSLKTLLYLLPGGIVSGAGSVIGVHFALKRR